MNHPISNLVEDVQGIDLDLAQCLKLFSVQPLGGDSGETTPNPTPWTLYRSSLHLLG